ncbi:hypothetical protein QQ056_16575 [Oscillatoria laete-virens NRMC-F 0139]|nr:hypothetical protein [Oscillatoria laete-virens]MDL5055150.1 hypothetical protein [Oscillatoria laete-virens NRMC-F 0139]
MHYFLWKSSGFISKKLFSDDDQNIIEVNFTKFDLLDAAWMVSAIYIIYNVSERLIRFVFLFISDYGRAEFSLNNPQGLESRIDVAICMIQLSIAFMMIFKSRGILRLIKLVRKTD